MSRPAIFITGAAAGIGRATAERFAARGWFVGLYDVAEGAVQALCQQLGPQNAIAGKLDVRDEAAFSAALAQFFDAASGRLDVLFNNAGILATGDFESIPLARHQLLVDINLKGVLNGCMLALPYLRRTPGARVISMCSASAIYGTPAFASYSATKFAVKGLSEALDIEWARHGIRVMDLLPLFVATPMLNDVAQPPAIVGRLGVRLTADDIAETVWRAAHWRLWRRVHWYPGLQGRLLALAQKFAPALLNRLVTRIASAY
jgi:NAD(P)-dependent dehydrogenase (short-subunit alcohol dehydrogenase family)